MDTNFIGNDTTLTAAKNGGCLVDQGSSKYVTTDSGISTNLTTDDYWTDYNHFYIHTTYSHKIPKKQK